MTSAYDEAQHHRSRDGRFASMDSGRDDAGQLDAFGIEADSNQMFDAFGNEYSDVEVRDPDLVAVPARESVWSRMRGMFSRA